MNRKIAPFLDEDGKIKQLPKKQAVRLAVLEYLAQQFAPDTFFTERQVNDICTDFHTFDDYFLLRRELVDNGLLGRERDGSRYWRILRAENKEGTPEQTEQPTPEQGVQ